MPSQRRDYTSGCSIIIVVAQRETTPPVFLAKNYLPQTHDETAKANSFY